MAKKTSRKKDHEPSTRPTASAAPSTAAPPTSSIGELTDEQKQVLYFGHRRAIKALRDKIASATGDLRNAYKRLKAELGITRKDMDFAFALDDDDGDATAEHQRRMMLARWEQHPLGTQADMFSEVSLAPAAEVAFGLGKKAGLAGDPCKPEYDPSTEQYREYMRGFHEGQAVLAGGIKPTAPDAPTGSVPREEWARKLREQNDDVEREIKERSAQIGSAPSTAVVSGGEPEPPAATH